MHKLQILKKYFKLIPADKKERFFAMLFLYIIVVIDPTVSNPNGCHIRECQKYNCKSNKKP
ncbi:unnamed protein product [Oikopleura dioica]|uniref:Uncharacterized protein n=1 Tax=Oikopleura dioica TaxID=34765 RepID=E4X851_OIKDI|nr:unnamed protein product [Oikopleura dioica]